MSDKNPEVSAAESDAVRNAIDALIHAAGLDESDSRTEPLIRSLLETSVALGADGVAIPDLKLLVAAVEEIRAGLASFRPYPQARKVTVFGSARTPREDQAYKMAVEFGRKLADENYMVITGAGPGIMQAGNEGAGREMSFGVNIRLPFEQSANPYIDDDPKLTDFKYFFTRKLFFLKEAAAVALFPGGFGTHDECYETLTLVQTGKSQLVPIVFLDVPGGTYWESWDAYVREHLLAGGLISPHDLALYKVTDDVEAAVREITGFYRIFHSARTIRGRLVMRLTTDVPDSVIDTISEEFADILGGEAVRRRAAYEEEADEPEALELPRLVMAFDQKNHGRLRMLVDRLNELG